MYLSASQIKMVLPNFHPKSIPENTTGCGRKWHHRYRQKLPLPGSVSTNLGSTLHACIERYLEAGDLEDVDIYPEGCFKDVTDEEAVKIVKLVDTGIEEGFIVKHQDRHVEHAIWDGKDHYELLKSMYPTWKEEALKKAAKGCWEIAPGILIPGFIDYWHSGTHITDWKTSSNPQKWGLNKDRGSTKYIGYDIQLLLYATYLWKVKVLKAKEFTIEHVYFQTKGKLQVKKVCEKIPVSVLKRFYEWLIVTVLPEFKKLSAMAAPEVKVLPYGEEACDMFMGCPYKKLCSGGLTAQEYINVTNIDQQIIKGGAVVGLLDAITNNNKKEEPAPETKQETKQETPAFAEKQDNTKQEKKTTPPKKPRKKGFTLLQNCAVIKGTGKVATLAHIMETVGSHIIDDLKEKGKCGSGVNCWHDLKQNSRSDILHAYKDVIFNAVDDMTIMVGQLNLDMNELFIILYPEAKTIYQGVIK